MDRRDFLSNSLTAFAAFNALPPLLAKTAAATGHADTPLLSPPAVFGADRFRQLLGSRFTIEREGVLESVTLAGVREGPRSPGLEQFTTVFACDRASAVAPGLYKVHHPKLGWFELRLDDVERDAQCAAVFNLLV